MDPVIACGVYEGDTVVQDETTIGRRKNTAQQRSPFQQDLIDCLFIPVLQETDTGLTQVAGKVLDRNAGPKHQAGIQNGVQAGRVTLGREATRDEVFLVRRTAP
jgi:hypothetical protein